MTSKEQPEVHWEYLPQDPQSFFALDDGYDRRDLKRAYNGLLRRFKPERFPDEFKRIRVAYEELEEHLRWRESYPEPEADSVDFDDLVSAAEDTAADMAAESVDGVELLSSMTLQATLAALDEFEHKSPENWCQLALLREELERDNPLVFFEVLIEGVRSTLGAHPVSTLLYSACQEDQSLEVAEPLLERMYDLCSRPGGATNFRIDGYFYYTEQLWLTLAGALPFDEFVGRLERQRQRIGDSGYEAYLGLLIRLIPRVGLRAEPAWIEEAMQEVDEHYHQLSPVAQDEVAHFDWLDRYRSNRETFLDGNAVRARIDDTLDLLSSGRQEEGTASLDALLASFRKAPELLMKAFPPGAEGEHLCVVDPLWWFAEEHALVLGGLHQHPEQEVIEFDVLRFAERLEHKTDRSLLGLLWMSMTLGSLALMLALVLGLPMWLFVSVTTGHPGLRVLSILGWLALVFVGSFRNFSFKDALFIPSAYWGVFFSKRIYRRTWRRECLGFLRDYRLSPEQFIAALIRIDEPGISNHQFLAEQLSQDTGMSLYSLAVQFED
jgi:hypothetical protein